MTIKWEKGDTYGPNEDGIWTSGLHYKVDPIEKSWWQRLEVYAKSKYEAEELRDGVLMCLNDEWDWSFGK